MGVQAHPFTRRRLLSTAAATAAVGVFSRAPVGLASTGLAGQASNVYADADQLYLTFGNALKDAVANSAVRELGGMDAVVMMNFVEPTAQIRLGLSAAGGSSVSFGSDDPDANVTLSLTGDLGHAMASGQLPIEEAVVDPDLTWSAQPADAVRAFIALPAALRPWYLRTLKDTGYAQLIPEPSPPAFASEGRLYDTLGQAMRKTVVQDPTFKGLQKVGKVVSWRFSGPSSEVALSLNSHPAAAFGTTAEAPDAVIRMTGDGAHRLFSGDFGVTEAISRGYLTYEGDTAALSHLIPLPPAVRPRYRQLAGLAALNG
jgi:hypothetical protein